MKHETSPGGGGRIEGYSALTILGFIAFLGLLDTERAAIWEMRTGNC